jgi:pimeloyl-ACP methyl ester carboxylesterase/GNAT superfamily N-acetyltransferase
MVSTVALRRAGAGEWQALGRLIGEAFADDPVSRWTLGSPRAIETTFAALCRHVYLPRGACTFAGNAGGAMWLRPGGSKALPMWAQASLAVQLLRLAGPACIRRSLIVDARMRAERPAQDHFYLFAVGVLPQGRGQGIGRALIQQMIDEADVMGLPCWLENTNPSNEALYRSLGFEVVETFEPAPGCPPLTTMRRRPEVRGEAKVGSRVPVALTAPHQWAPDESLQLDDALRSALGVSQVQLSAGTTRYTARAMPGTPLVVLIHGYSAPSYVWEGVANHLQRAGLSTLTYDLYGHGLSDRPRVDYTRELFAQQLRELLDKLQPSQRVHLVGWSMGAMVAAAYALEHPERVASVTMVSPSGLPIRVGLMGRLAMTPVVGDIGIRLLGGYGMRRAQRAFFEDSALHQRYMREFEEQTQYVGFRRAMLSTLRCMDMDNFADEYIRYGRLAPPTLVLWATSDRATPYSNHMRFLTLVPSASLVPLKGVGHASLYEAPGEIASAVVSHVQANATHGAPGGGGTIQA